MTVVLTTSSGFGKHGRVPGLMAEKGWELMRCADNSWPVGGLGEHIARAYHPMGGLVPATAKTPPRDAARLPGQAAIYLSSAV